MIVFLVAVVLVGLWFARRRARARQLAGLDSARPVFSVEPPRRRVGSRKGELL